MKQNLRRMLIALLCVCIMIPGVLPGDVFHTKDSQVFAEETAGAYDRQMLQKLVTDNQFTVSDSDISLTKDEASKGVVIRGEKAKMQGATFSFTEAFDFDDGMVSRICIDALTAKSTNVTLGFYLDDDTSSFATARLSKQKKLNNWTKSKTISVDMSDLKLTGKHTLTMKVLDASAEDVTFMLRSIEFVKSSVPVVYFDIDESEGSITEMNASEDHSEECYGDMTLKVPDGYVSEYTDKQAKGGTYSMEYIRGRGNSTWYADKKPYKIKLDKKSELLGMGKNKHWVLLANYYDNSLLRNRMTYWLGKELEMNFTPKSIPVEVVMNGEYYGSYFLSEQIRVGKNRVNIDDLEDSEETKNATDPATISGGYLLSMFPYGEEKNLSFSTKKQNQFLIESPSFEGYKNDIQYNYIKNYVQKTEDAIYGTGFKNSEGQTYTEFMDMNAAIDYYWVQAFSKNGDAFVSTSTYLYKPRGGKLFWGPLWDFDYVAWGSTEYEGHDVIGWDRSTWFERLLDDPVFAQKIVDRWPVLKAKLEKLIEDGGQLDSYGKELSTSAKYNFEKWGMSELGQNENLTYEQEIDRLKTWIEKRMEWVDNNVQLIIPRECTITYLVNGKTYTTQKGIVGKSIEKFPSEPKKKGYVFAGWWADYSIDFEEYLKANGITLEDLREDFTEKEIKDLMKNGFRYKGYFKSSNDIPGDIELTAKFIPENKVVDVKKVVLSREKINKEEWDGGFDLNATVIPFDATKQELTWSSSNENVVTVEDGLVNIVGPGDAVVTATAPNGVKATCAVHIYPQDDEAPIGEEFDFELSDTNIKMKVGGYKELKVTYSPEDGIAYDDCIFISADESIVSARETGVLYGEGAGKTVVVVLNPYTGDVQTCRVTVTAPAKKVKVGDKVTNKGLKYQVTKTGKGATVKCIGASKKTIKTASIPKTIKIKGKSYKVTAIGKAAFKKYSSLKKVTIGSYVKTSGQEAFYGAKNLKAIQINSKSLTVGKNAFAKINKNAVFSVPKASLASYKKKFKDFKVVAIKAK